VTEPIKKTMPVEEEPVLWKEEEEVLEEETADKPSLLEEPASIEEDNTPVEEAMIVEALEAIKPAMVRIEDIIEN
jgi:hypothetical protein